MPCRLNKEQTAREIEIEIEESERQKSERRAVGSLGNLDPSRAAIVIVMMPFRCTQRKILDDWVDKFEHRRLYPIVGTLKDS